jgi:hypothetical protein
MSTATSSAVKGPVQLHYKAGQVVITAEDEDRFVMGSFQAVSACQNAIARDRFVAQFRNDFLNRLYNWCRNNSRNVLRCYVPFGSYGECIKVFVVNGSARFDFNLSDSIADLELELADAGWPCDILQIASGTPEEIRAFFDPAQSIQVFGDGIGEPASREG